MGQSNCIRYIIYDGGCEICEDFLGFCPLSLEIEYLRVQGYDEASTMSGHVSGVQQRIRELQPQALFTYCQSHVLNIVVVYECSDIPIIRNTMATIEKIDVLFFVSAVKKSMLQEQPQGSKETQASDKRKQEASHSCQTHAGGKREDSECFSVQPTLHS